MIHVVEKQPAGGAGASSQERGGWLSVIDPDAEEVARLRDEFGIPEELVAHALDFDERPRADTAEKATLVVLRVPLRQPGSADVPYTTVPLGLVLSANWIATISPCPNEVMARLRTYAERDWPAGKHHRLVLHALDVTAQAFLAHLRRIQREVDELEVALRTSMRNREVIGLLRYQKCLVFFATALRAIEMMLERLQRSPAFHIPPEDEGMLEDVLVEIRQAIDVTTVSSHILSEMMDAFASIISNNLNVVMKFLTSITVILTFPLMVSSFYGMNVELPIQRSPLAFGWLLAISAVFSALVGVGFRKKNWL